MSIEGLYDSELGDKLARKTLTPFNNGLPLAKGSRPRQLCACGNTVAFPYISRRGSYVCKQCAIDIPRRYGGHATANKCAKCHKILTRARLVVRKGNLVCKACAKEF